MLQGNADVNLDDIIVKGLAMAAQAAAERIERYELMNTCYLELKEKEEVHLVELDMARKAREEALIKMEQAVKTQEEREKHWKSRDQASKEISERMQNNIRAMEKALAAEHEKTTKALNERNDLTVDLEKANAEKERLAQKADHIIEQFKESDEGSLWVTMEMAPFARQLGEEIMHFFDVKLGAGHPGIDWNEHPHCQEILIRKKKR